jgi:hypothetical protein
MKKTTCNWLVTGNNITINYKNQTHIIPRTDKLADEVIALIKCENWDGIMDLIDVSKKIESFSNGTFKVENNTVMINGVAAPQILSSRILEFADNKLPYEPLVKFAEKLQQNPSFRAVNELYLFLEKNNHPITETGNFIAYKKVRPDFKDVYTGTMDNSVGTVVEMPRNKVNEDANQTCSYGLHVANWDYAHNIYNAGVPSIMLEVEVNPKDVVAVPVDYNNAKMRVCAYKVLGVVDKENSGSPLRITESMPEEYNDCDYCEGDPCSTCEDALCDQCSCSDCEYMDEDEESEEDDTPVYGTCSCPCTYK